jgi:transcriptional regulator with XRE-family HTH domain
MKLASRIRRARDIAGLSQTRLAAQVEVQRSAVSQWEHAVGTRPTVENLAKIATACVVRFEWLATGRGPMRLDESQQAPALVTSEFAHDDLEARLLLAVRKFTARKREAIVEMIEKLGG